MLMSERCTCITCLNTHIFKVCTIIYTHFIDEETKAHRAGPHAGHYCMFLQLIL